jgi:membrane protease YdiL (CAAX protease family)
MRPEKGDRHPAHDGFPDKVASRRAVSQSPFSLAVGDSSVICCKVSGDRSVKKGNNRDQPRATTMNDDPVLKYYEVSTVTEGDVVSVNPSEVKEVRPWGPWASICWGLLLFVVMVVVQTVVFLGFVVVQGATTLDKMKALSSDALVLSVTTFASTPIIIGLIVLLIYFRGCSIRDYLAWRIPELKTTGLAVAGLALLLISIDALTFTIGRPIVPEVMVDIYKTGWIIPLVLTMIVAAPVGEEIFFRGFVFEGIARSKWGPFVAILLTSVAWGAIHLQYDAYSVVMVIFMGFYLGEVRRRTKSLPLTIFLHGIANLVATTEMVIKVQMDGG